MRVVGLVDGYFGLILVFSAMQLPLALWIMKTYFDTIPHDYDEAALVDGAALFQRIRLVIAPLALPGLGAAGLFAFIARMGGFPHAAHLALFIRAADVATRTVSRFSARAAD